MTKRVTVRRIGNSLGVILGKAELQAMGVGEGDKLVLVPSPEGLMLTPFDPIFVEAMEATDDYMRRHRDALKELAK